MKRVPIKIAKDLGKKLGMKRVILILVDPACDPNPVGPYKTHVVTWGKDYEDCVKAAEIGNVIKRHIFDWPEYLCHAKPARQIRKEKSQ